MDKTVTSLTQELLQVYDQLNVLYDVGEMLSSAPKDHDAVQSVLEFLKEILDLDICWLILNNENGTNYEKSIYGKDHEFMDELKDYVAKNLKQTDRIIVNTSKPYDLHIIGVGIKSEGKMKGQVIYGRDCHKPIFTTNEGKLCSFVTNYIANTVYSSNQLILEKGSEDKGKRIDHEVIASFLTALQVKEKHIAEHSRRVAANALTLLSGLKNQMKISPMLEEHIEAAALLHDVGTLGINDQVLIKPFLTEIENQYYQTHCQKGYEILKHFGNEMINTVVLEHHERYDGHGYPRGLKGDQISLMAQIIAVADTYDHLTNNIVYNKSISKEKAFEEIIIASGTKFSPVVVNAFISTFKK